MLFNSYAFLGFLPIVWGIYFLLNRFGLFKTAMACLAAASFVFYGFMDYRLCFLLGGSIVVNYALHLGLMNPKSKEGLKKFLLTAGILANFGVLYYFKYLNFTLENLNRFLHLDVTLLNIALPLGISFYTFQQVSFVVDSFEGKMEKYPFLEYCVFVAFFPQLVAGPIVLHQEMVPQFRDPEKRRVNYGNLMKGVQYFILGLGKKVLVADSFARICDLGYGQTLQLHSISAILTILTYTLEIYFDFSGYCDMAMGLGWMFNIEIPKNFTSPYKADSISDFWKRWHMTLTRFLTRYLYIPLGGSRRGNLRTYINVMIVFTASGLWHGAAWTFLLWGMLHGAAMVLHRMTGKIWEKVPHFIRWFATFLFVNLAWTFFRAEYFRQPLRLMKQIFAFGSDTMIQPMSDALCNGSLGIQLLQHYHIGLPGQAVSLVILCIWTLLWTVVCAKAPSSHEIVEKDHRSIGWYLVLSLIFTVSVYQLSGLSKFIYFNF